MSDKQNIHPTTIGRLDSTTKTWTKVGEMNSWKRKHRVIHDGTYFIVVGGGPEYGGTEDGFRETERCSLVGTSMTCITQEPTLSGYDSPALFLVDEDFCKEYIV